MFSRGVSLLLAALATIAAASPISDVSAAIATTKHFVTFGSSTTQTGFSVNGTAPSSKNPIGNPALPGWTTSGGLNWVGFAITKYNATEVLSYNLAVGGATTDNGLIPTYTTGIATFVDQVNIFYEAYVKKKAPWEWRDLLVGIWVANNDVGNSYAQSNISTLYPKVSAAYFEQAQRLYDAGARNFVFLTCAPQDLTPLFISQGTATTAKVAAAVKLYNNILKTNFDKFKASHPAAKAWLVDTAVAYETALNNPTGYGAPDATCTNEDGYSCLWWNNYHPGIQIHRILGKNVGKAVGAPWF
ncbi:Acetylesterase [Colletotrichum spinosum]|uniref:Acetylesterase n=1 Tax=Colletotrichum spinosum TaxID=1347390 RepID=A0A4V3HSS1_9PEZI|nr:Acetylesterase [Colletotrichum spinosum]